MRTQHESHIGRRLRRLGLAAAMLTAVAVVPQSESAAAVEGDLRVSTYIPIVPCRLLDTRPDTKEDQSRAIGPRIAPIHVQESYTFKVHGKNGNCDIPTSAIGITANFTIDYPTDQSYLTVWPADAERPLSSVLNWIKDNPPNPNFVATPLSADGAFSVFNNAGDVDLIVDINGYYELRSSGDGTGGTQGAKGDTGPQGEKGDKGDPGATGAPGAPGAPGPKGDKGDKGDPGTPGGLPGADGKTIRNGVGAPTAATPGVDGDFYIDTQAHVIYGPKAGTWPLTGTSLVGPKGDPGTNGTNGTNGAPGAAGADGKTIRTGTTPPTAATPGADGDFYIDTQAHVLYGPKAGAWPQTGTSLVGPQGPAGANGSNGTNGAPGADGKTIRTGTTPPTAATPGADGDFYIDTQAHVIYGPKAGTWPPTGTSLVGPQGPPGLNGAAGQRGSMTFKGDVPPTDADGLPGDYYIWMNGEVPCMFGPKKADGTPDPWGLLSGDPYDCVNLRGPQGPAGAAGINGTTIIPGDGPPINGPLYGRRGDFYIDQINWDLYGPKDADGIWPLATSLIGPKGEAGDPGKAGSAGPAGPAGSSLTPVGSSGQTITGSFATQFPVYANSGAPTSARVWSTTVSFTGKLPANLTSGSVNFAASSGANDQDPNCTGTFAAPTAPAGVVCIYPNVAVNATPNTAGALPALADQGFVASFTLASVGAPVGAVVSFTWAYKVP